MRLVTLLKSILSIILVFFILNLISAETKSMQGSNISMIVNGQRFNVSLQDSEAARAFENMLPISLSMEDFNRNEKHTRLPISLPTQTVTPGRIYSGDLMLFGSNTLVLFYLSFNSSYSYTRIGKVDNPSQLQSILGSGSVQIQFTK